MTRCITSSNNRYLGILCTGMMRYASTLCSFRENLFNSTKDLKLSISLSLGQQRDKIVMRGQLKRSELVGPIPVRRYSVRTRNNTRHTS